MKWAIATVIALFVSGWVGYSLRDTKCDNQVLVEDNSRLEAVAKAYGDSMAENFRLQDLVDQQAKELGEKRETVRTVFRTLEKEVIRDAEVVYRDAECSVPQRFVRVWNHANQAGGDQPPASPSESGPLDDGSPSGVGLAEIEAQHIREAEVCTDAILKVKAWQAFYPTLKAICSGEQEQ